MKKFFIILCGILIMGDAAADWPTNYQQPRYYAYSASSDPWKSLTTNGNYSKTLSGSSLYPNLSNQMSKVSSSNHGTHDDEGAVVLIMARDIFKNGNGGMFCTTQVQAANQNGRRYTWIDYYDYPGKYKCEPLCRPGYYGTECSQTGTPDSCYTDKLDFGSLTQNTSGKWEQQKTTSTSVLWYQNSKASSTTTAEHRILAVVKKMDHGVIVSPVSVIAERYQSGNGNGKYSWIKSVNSNGNEFLLCAQGYEPNASGTDCQEPSWCGQKKALDNLCPGYTANGYDSDIHKLEYNETNKCYVIKCDYSNYGFKSKNDTTCVECDGGVLAYVNADGLCDKCEKGQYPNSNGNGCIDKSDLNTYSQMQMKSGPSSNRECWLETDPNKFGGCVICSTNNQCWDGKNCGQCD